MSGEETLRAALFKEKRVNVLAVLLDQPEHRFTLTELKEQADVSKPLVIDLVNALNSRGIVNREKKGGTVLVSVNEENSATKHLRALLEIDAAPLREAAKQFTACLEQEISDSLVTAVLFGSVARGTPHLRSDVDILVIVEKEEVSSRVDGCTAKIEQTEQITVSPVVMEQEEAVERVESRDSFIANVAEDGIVLHGEDAWSEIRGAKR